MAWKRALQSDYAKTFYVAAVVCGFIALALQTWTSLSRPAVVAALFTVPIVVFFESRLIWLPLPQGAATLVTPLLFPLATNYGFASAALVLAISSLPLLILYRRNHGAKFLAFNLAEYGVSTYAGLAAFQAFGGRIGSVSWHNWIPLCAYIIGFFFANVVIVVMFLALQDEEPLLHTAHITLTSHVLTLYAIMMVLGAVMALALPATGIVSIYAIGAVLWLVGLSHRMLYDALDAAYRDELTNLFNRRKFYVELDKCFASRQQPVSLLFLDLDHFKRFNDTYGHVQGDRLLREVARLIAECVGRRGTAYRYGGEEFSVLLPQHDTAGAVTVAEAIRAAIESYRFHTAAGELLTVTVSIGIATYPDTARSQDELLEQADTALYRVKNTSRNATAVFGVN